MQVKNFVYDLNEMYYVMRMSIYQISKETGLDVKTIERLVGAYPEDDNIMEKNYA